MAACAGEYTGTYRGDVSGNLSGELDGHGRFEVTFWSPSAEVPLSGSGSVDDEGKILVNIQRNRITGALDEQRCSARGDWQFDVARGTWQMKRL